MSAVKNALSFVFGKGEIDSDGKEVSCHNITRDPVPRNCDAVSPQLKNTQTRFFK